MNWKCGAIKKNTVEENEPEKLNKLLKTEFAEVKKEQKRWQPHESHDSYTCQAFKLTRIQFFYHNNSDFKPCGPLQEKGVLLLSLSVFVKRRPLL